MDELMSEKVGALAEGLPTLTALIGLLPSVDDQVSEKVGALAEGLPTLMTCIGFGWLWDIVRYLRPQVPPACFLTIRWTGLFSTMDYLTYTEVRFLEKGFTKYLLILGSGFRGDSLMLNRA